MKKIKKRLLITFGILLILIVGLFVYLNFDIIYSFTNPVPKNPAKKITLGVPRTMSIQGQIREAKKLMDDAQFSKASNLLSAVLKKDPTLLPPYKFLGEIYLQTKDFQKLENIILEIEKRFPNDQIIDILKIKKLIIEKKLQKVLNIIENNENLPNSLKFYEAVLLALQNNHEKSREILVKLKKLPVDPDENSQKNFKIKEGFVSEKFSQKVLDLVDVYDEFDKFADGKNPHLFALISKKLAENNEAVLAKEFANVAIKEDPEYVDSWVLRGYAEYLMQDYENSLIDLYQAYELDKSRPETYYFLALALEKNGNLQEAASFFEKSLEFDFDFSAEIRWKLIDIFIAEEKYNQVAKLYEELATENPKPEKFISATHNLINILKNPQAAIKTTEKLVQENPRDILSLNLNAWALIANNNLDKAEIVLKEALELNKENPRTALNFGILYEAHGDYTLAREWFKKSYEYGKGRGFDDIVNMAADKFNNLVDKENPAKLSPNDKRDASSP
jgi:tetratricopeptide (TPR) repeat protein